VGFLDPHEASFSMNKVSRDYDLILVGGGLANALIAWRRWVAEPETRMLLLEENETLGGNHTWSFHEHDLEPEQKRWIEPLIVKAWDRYEVHFPKLERTLESRYFSITSERLHEYFFQLLGKSVRTRAQVTHADSNEVTLANGERFTAACVLDGRGFSAEGLPCPVGYQKFVGLDLELSAPHGLKHPVLMDARCEQKEGFRFFYFLPWSETSLLLEDTRYSNSGELDIETLVQEVLDRAKKLNWKVKNVKRRECGALPLPLENHFPAPESGGPVKVGVRGGFFHPVTGYSLPWAARLADRIANIEVRNIATEVQKQSIELASQFRFYFLLNRFLFNAAVPQERYRILEKFYALPPEIVERFYSGKINRWDELRILSGRPPISLKRAIECFI
jgi:lycopene beta-cyclase